MHPVLIEFLGFKLYTFGAMMSLAFMAGFYWMLRRAKALGEDVNLYLEAACWMIIAAVFGARLFYIFFFPTLFWQDPLGVIFSQGGLVWYGGMVGVIAVVFLYSRLRGLNFFRFGDILAPPAALGLALGRIGCLMAGCCYGGHTDLPWGIHYPTGHPTFGHAVHPAPVYESLLMVLVAIVLAKVNPQRQGQATALFLVLYGLVRFSLEYLRGDRLVWLEALNLSASQIISLLGILAGGLLLIYVKRPSPVSTRL